MGEGSDRNFILHEEYEVSHRTAYLCRLRKNVSNTIHAGRRPHSLPYLSRTEVSPRD